VTDKLQKIRRPPYAGFESCPVKTLLCGKGTGLPDPHSFTRRSYSHQIHADFGLSICVVGGVVVSVRRAAGVTSMTQGRIHT
jgi:hypothetical protein